jgi:hypothetical protein
MQAIAADKANLHFLHRTQVQVASNIYLLGTTLHSFIPSHAEKEIAQRMNDFHLIGDHKHKWTVSRHNDEHRKDVAWLGQTITEISEKHQQAKIIVMTHHGPLEFGLSRPAYEVESHHLRYAFQTDLTHHDWFKKVHTFISGHTHHNVDFVTKEGVRIVSNQKGYKDECDDSDPENKGRAYNKDFVVEIKD